MAAETLTVSGFVCARCRTKFAERFVVCSRCWESGVCVPDYERKIDALVGVAGRRLSARALAAEDQAVMPLVAYPEIKIQQNAFVVIHGAPASGKTTMALRVAEKLLPAAFCAAEMRVGPVLSSYLRRLEIRSERLELFDASSVESIVETARSGVRCLVLDSLSVLSFLPDDVLGLSRDAGLIIVGILQHCKDGTAAGLNAWLHAADIIIKCDALNWFLEKSRYQELQNVSGGVL